MQNAVGHSTCVLSIVCMKWMAASVEVILVVELPELMVFQQRSSGSSVNINSFIHTYIELTNIL